MPLARHPIVRVSGGRWGAIDPHRPGSGRTAPQSRLPEPAGQRRPSPPPRCGGGGRRRGYSGRLALDASSDPLVVRRTPIV